MPCTKAELIAAINSYASARTTNDGPLINMAAAALGQVVDTLGAISILTINLSGLSVADLATFMSPSFANALEVTP